MINKVFIMGLFALGFLAIFGTGLYVAGSVAMNSNSLIADIKSR